MPRTECHEAIRRALATLSSCAAIEKSGRYDLKHEAAATLRRSRDSRHARIMSPGISGEMFAAVKDTLITPSELHEPGAGDRNKLKRYDDFHLSAPVAGRPPALR